MKKLSTFLSVFLLLLCFTQIDAQKKFARQGVVEIGGSISFSNFTMVSAGETADDSQSLLQIMPYIGFFVADGFELGFLPGFNLVDMGTEGIDPISNLMLFFVPSYNFNTGGTVYPYIEGYIGYSSLSVTTEAQPLLNVPAMELTMGGLSYGGRGGVKVGIGKTGLLNIGVQYLMLDFTPSEDADMGIPAQDERSGLNWLAVTAGVSIYIE